MIVRIALYDGFGSETGAAGRSGEKLQSRPIIVRRRDQRPDGERVEARTEFAIRIDTTALRIFSAIATWAEEIGDLMGKICFNQSASPGTL